MEEIALMALPLQDEDTEADEQDMSTASSSAPILTIASSPAQDLLEAPPQSSHELVAELSTEELHAVKYSDGQSEHRAASSGSRNATERQMPTTPSPLTPEPIVIGSKANTVSSLESGE